MSYDLGYDTGYDDDAVIRIERRPARWASEAAVGGYLMNGTGPVRGGSPPMDPSAFTMRPGESIEDFQARMMNGLLGGGSPAVGGPGSPSPVPGSEGTGGTSGSSFGSPPPVAPGAPDPNAPAVTSDAPVMSADEVRTATSSADWTNATDDLAAYGMQPAEIDAFRAQYAGRDPAALRSDGILPPALPREGDPPRPVAPDTAARGEVLGNVRTRLRDDMVATTADRIHTRMPELSRETCTSLAEQMYRRHTGSADVGANPPTGETIAAMGGARGAVSGTYNEIFPTGASATTITASDNFQSLYNDAIASERSAFTAAAGPGFAAADATYYGRADRNPPTPVHAGRRDRDARLFLQDRRIADDPGAIRRARSSGTLNAELSDFHNRVGNEGTAARPSTNPSRRSLEAAMERDPIDRSRLSAQQRFELDREENAFYRNQGETIRAEGVRAGEATVAFDRQRFLSREDRAFQLGMAGLNDAMATRRDEANHRRQMIGQMTNFAMQSGMQLMQSQIQHLNQLTTIQLQDMLQRTSRLVEQGNLGPDIVRQMLGGGGGGRR